MPRKYKTPVSKIRNRESQQRSRARHRDLVDGLKQKLDEYERLGVAASLEMQMAARAVHVENRRLRALLGILGASSEDIGVFLASSDHHEIGEAATTYAERYDGAGPPTTSHGLYPSPTKSRSKAVAVMPLSPATSSVSIQHDDAIVTTMPTLQNSTEMTMTEMDECSQGRTFTSSTILAEVSDCFCPREPHPRHGSPVDRSETSCDVAAAILIELHNQTDPAQVRDALGCMGTKDCSVKNTKIFQLIDSLP